MILFWDFWFLQLVCDFFICLFYAVDSVTMQAQKEAPSDLHCKDKFLLQSAVVTAGTSQTDITADMVITLLVVRFRLCRL